MPLLINIDVPDLSAAEAFYTLAFGLTVLRRLRGGITELAGWPVPVFLLEKPEGSVRTPGCRRTYARHWTPLHLDVVVPDVEAAFRQVLASGGICEMRPTITSFGRIAQLADPFGHGVCLLEFTGKGYDSLEDPHFGARDIRGGADII